MYVAAVRSYLAYNDIDIVPTKFKRMVRLPKIYREDEEALDGADIRKLLLACNNRRIKALLLVLASGGMRSIEAMTTRLRDLDFSASPTKVHIRKEFSKTRVGRDVYISEEATEALKRWIEWKFRTRTNGNKTKTPERSPDALVFTRVNYTTATAAVSPRGIYPKVYQEFSKLLRVVGMHEIKDGRVNRHKYSLHSLRRYCKSVISTQARQDYSEWFLGHAKSPYWTLKEEQKREIYQKNCMPFLTFLDYGALENTSKGIIATLEHRNEEVAYLRDRDLKREAEMKEMRQTMDKILSIVQENPKLAGVKKEVLSQF